MSKFSRIGNILLGAVVIFICAVMFIVPESGSLFFLLFLGIAFLVYGIRYLVYFFSMAKHMVGGLMIFFISIIALDIGAFTLTLSDESMTIVSIYLALFHGFYGVVHLLRAREAKHYDSPAWKWSLAECGVNFLVVIICSGLIPFSPSPYFLIYICAAGLAYGAVMRIINACRRTAIIYIQ